MPQPTELDLKYRPTRFDQLIGESQRDLWLTCMAEALDACKVTGEIRDFLDARFAHVANFMRNDEEG